MGIKRKAAARLPQSKAWIGGGLAEIRTYRGTNIASTADMVSYGTWSNQVYYSFAQG